MLGCAKHHAILRLNPLESTISPNRYPDMPSGLSVKKSIVFVASNYFLRVGDNKTEAPALDVAGFGNEENADHI